MKQRIITAVVALSLVGAVVYAGKTAFFCLVLLCSVIAMYEYYRMIAENKSLLTSFLPCVCCAAIILTNVYYPNLTLGVLTLSFLIVFVQGMLHDTTHARVSVFGVWALIYIGLFISYLLKILVTKNGEYIAYPLILSVIACDTFAYFIGIKYGKHKLCPNISPKKSVEGSIAGFIAAYIVFAATLFFAKDVYIPNKLFLYLTGGIVIGVTEQLGDLAASLVKREFNTKDYGNILPGHGGVLDRIDGLLFASAGMYIYANVVINLI